MKLIPSTNVFYSVTLRGIPSYLLAGFACGRRSAGLIENVVSEVFGAGLPSSMADERNADVVLPGGQRCEIRAKAATSTNAWSTKTSFEGRGANGQKTQHRSEEKWAAADYFIPALFTIVGDELLVEFYLIETATTARPATINRRGFAQMRQALPHIDAAL
jgi:hypothetical protein